MDRLRIAINAQATPNGEYGGIITVLRALAALPELEDGAEEYVFVGPYDDPEWMRSILPPGQRIVRGPKVMSSVAWNVDRFEPFKRRLGPLRPLARGMKQFLATQVSTNVATMSVEAKPGEPLPAFTAKSFFQSLGCEVIHFPFQAFEECGLPSIYNPHDLQHLHLPQFFTPNEISRRENLYPIACHSAHTVVVASQIVKRDVIERYGVQADKVQVIPWAPPPVRQLPDPVNKDLSGLILKKYEFAGKPFVLYPAMTWEHKNHLRLLEALAHLRDSAGLVLRVICTGFKTDFWPNIEKRLYELELQEFVKFPGLVALEELNALYRAAQFVFIPTLFEAASAPVFEAWQHRTPVACSTVTSLPEQVADAALLFSPFSVNEIAIALQRMSTDSGLREDLRQRGTLRLREFSLERTAKTYRAVYRRAAGRTLTEEDRQLLGGGRIEGSGKESEVLVSG